MLEGALLAQLAEFGVSSAVLIIISSIKNTVFFFFSSSFLIFLIILILSYPLFHGTVFHRRTMQRN